MSLAYRHTINSRAAAVAEAMGRADLADSCACRSRPDELPMGEVPLIVLIPDSGPYSDDCRPRGLLSRVKIEAYTRGFILVRLSSDRL